MFKSFRGLLKGVGFVINRNNERQLGFAHPVGSASPKVAYNSNDDVTFNAYHKDGSVHKVKLVDSLEYLDQHKDDILRQVPNFRRPKIG